MRLHILPLVFATTLGVASAAFAATTTTGTVKAFDMKIHTLTLEDGNIYNLPAGFKDPGLKVGEKVSVVWNKTANEGETKIARDAVTVSVLG